MPKIAVGPAGKKKMGTKAGFLRLTGGKASSYFLVEELEQELSRPEEIGRGC